MVVNLCLGKNASGYPAKICAFHLKRKVKKKEKRADKTTLSSLQKAHNLKKKKKSLQKRVPECPDALLSWSEWFRVGRGGGLRRKYIKQEPVVRAGAQSNKCLLNEYPVKRKARPRTRPSSQ